MEKYFLFFIFIFLYVNEFFIFLIFFIRQSYSIISLQAFIFLFIDNHINNFIPKFNSILSYQPSHQQFITIFLFYYIYYLFQEKANFLC